VNLTLTNPILLFKPSGNIEWQQDFAQIPFGYVHGDKLKVVFATRRKPDKDRAYCSFPAEAVFALKDLSLVSLSEKPLLDLGGVGSFDEFGVMPGSILKLNTGEEVMYYCGWSRSHPAPYRWSIGIAYRQENGQFERIYQGPIIGQSIDYPFLTASPVVFPTKDFGYEMFHLSGTSWHLIDNRLESRYSIVKSISQDGIRWDRSSLELGRVRWSDECQTSPNFFMFEGSRFMTFSYRSQIGFRKQLDRNYKTALVQEVDDCNWSIIQRTVEVREKNNIRDDIAYLSTFMYEDRMFALYNYSAGFGTSGIYISTVQLTL